jgi:hypothetical protein
MAIDSTSGLKQLDMKNAHVISQVEPKRVKDLQNGSQLPTIDEGEIE